jgi:hypothetical protein
MQGVLPPSASQLKPGNAAIAPGGLQLPMGQPAGAPGLPQLSGEGAAPGGAAGPEGLQAAIQQLVAAITQATGKPPTPQQLQAAIMGLVGGGPGGAPGGAPASGPIPT